MTSTVLITGCSSGFGAATARAFARRGWSVIATARRPETARDLESLPGIFVTRLDVQDRASIDTAVAAGIARFGGIDALVNNAGFGLFGVFEATPRDKIEEQFAVNLFGVMDVTRAVLPHFRANRRGVVVNVSSGAGVFGLPMISLYCASKFALEGFSESLAYELADLGIRVKLVEPGGVTSTRFSERSFGEVQTTEAIPDYADFVEKTQTLFRRLGEARSGATSEEVAEVIVAATVDDSDRLRYVATEDIKPLVAARRETSEEEYRAFMRRALGLDG